ncbi:hypothetical protein PPERSA_00345 [Pseudocohnilembus persalinus]|uniref:Gamma tubulin complex component C-terminal domain-containing protein n=1 Tax=Pseudocohnilembus persalinus TaxID=266149 RepID=A0A0V0QY99_PSEPJ|nr:hypothetical protein PPERSA_00345 [Pseudocohnilembus persalinus]|eukprot:KRX07188.1 hypothetical protein PPERSA_00345 [Pseudocohnilembus persalinus]
MQEELNKQANLILKNNLVALLESAIRSSNVQYMNQDIQQRLDVKLLQASSGDRGWDIFSLNYIVENPIQTILTPETILKYLKIFNFLWRIKRVAHSLSEVWLLHMKNNRYLSHFKYLKQTSLRCNMLRQEMLHFIDNLFNYLMVEVIETAWKHFQDSLNNIKDFKEIIDVHQKFVDQILERLLLTQKSEKIHRQLLRIFDLILRFKYTQDMMITDIQEEYNRKKQIKLQRDALNIIGENLNSESEESGDEALKQNEKGTLKHFKQISSDFKTAFTELQSLLKKEDDLRFLTFRIDFNEFYSSKKQYGSLYDMEELKSHGFDQKMFQNNSQFFSNNNQQQHQQYQQQLQQQQNKLRVFPSQHKFADTTNQPQANYFKNVINSDYNQKKQLNQQSNLAMQFKKDNYLQPQQLQTSNIPQQNQQQQAFNNFVNLTGKTSNYSDITQQQPPQNKFFNKQLSYNEGSSMINNNKNTTNYFNKMEEEKNKNQIENNTNNYNQLLNQKNKNNNQQNFYQQESEDSYQDQNQQLDQQQQLYNDDDINNNYSDQDD